MTTETPGESIFVLHTRWATRRDAFGRAPHTASPESLARLRDAERALIAALKAHGIAAYVNGPTVYRIVSDHGVERMSVSRYPTLYDLFDTPEPAPDAGPPARDIRYVPAPEGLDSDLAAIDAEVR